MLVAHLTPSKLNWQTAYKTTLLSLLGLQIDAFRIFKYEAETKSII